MGHDDFKIKEYNNWDLFMHVNQYPYLGRCYAWAKDSEASTIMDMNAEMRDELLGTVFLDWHSTVTRLFAPEWENLAIFGNSTPHLHAHFIPRYHSPRFYNGFEFIDPNPNGNYAPFDKKELNEETLMRIKDSLCGIINPE